MNKINFLQLSIEVCVYTYHVHVYVDSYLLLHSKHDPCVQ